MPYPKGINRKVSGGYDEEYSSISERERWGWFAWTIGV